MYTDEYGVQEYSIPVEVTLIDDSAFAGVLGITRVTFINSDVTIGMHG